MYTFKTLATLVAFTALSTFLVTGNSTSVSAEAPECVGSTSGGPKRFTCTDDFQAKPSKPTSRKAKRLKVKKKTYKRYQYKPTRFKLKTIPCYQSPVPGCED